MNPRIACEVLAGMAMIMGAALYSELGWGLAAFGLWLVIVVRS